MLLELHNYSSKLCVRSCFTSSYKATRMKICFMIICLSLFENHGGPIFFEYNEALVPYKTDRDT